MRQFGTKPEAEATLGAKLILLGPRVVVFVERVLQNFRLRGELRAWLHRPESLEPAAHLLPPPSDNERGSGSECKEEKADNAKHASDGFDIDCICTECFLQIRVMKVQVERKCRHCLESLSGPEDCQRAADKVVVGWLREAVKENAIFRGEFGLRLAGLVPQRHRLLHVRAEVAWRGLFSAPKLVIIVTDRDFDFGPQLTVCALVGR